MSARPAKNARAAAPRQRHFQLEAVEPLGVLPAEEVHQRFQQLKAQLAQKEDARRGR